MNDSPMLFEERETACGRRIGFATLNRPKQLNALNLEMCQLMLDRFRRWASDERIVAVVLDAAGDKGFSAGGDVAEVIRQVRAGGPERFIYGDAFFDVEYQLDLMIHTYPKPLMSYAHGICMGGGVGLAVGASHRVVSDNARVAMPEIHIGLFPDVGGGWFMNRVPGGAGTLMALTGLTVNEADALHAGLVDYFVPTSARADLYEKMSELPWSDDATANREALTGLLLGEHGRFKAALPESKLQQHQETIRYIAGQPSVGAMRDALLEAAEQDPWFKIPANSLANGSPTAAHVTWEYLRRTKRMSLAEVLALDLTLARQFQRHCDFPEGVRALLIDKDRAPKWSPARFEDVSRDLVAEHFSW
ncbi:MAG: hypothetical protein RIS35_2768 [Pseudomonadota bacterium]|jgi:enoyl-CoA hydratase/carnithine racemase